MSETIQSVENEENIFSENEICIGTFLGKALYRKVYKVNLDIYNGSGDVPYNISAITGCLVDVYAIIYGGDKNSASFNTKDHGDTGCYYSETGNTVHIHEDIAGLSTVPLKVKAIVVEYTKEVW